MIYIIIILVYLISAYFVWLYFKLALSYNGIWSLEGATLTDVSIVFIPFINTIAALGLWSISSPLRPGKRNFNKFFKINKNK